MLGRGLTVVLLLTIFGMSVVWQRVEVTRLGYATQGLAHRKRALEEENLTLTGDIAALTAPDRIMRILRENQARLTEPSIILQLSHRTPVAVEAPQ